MIRESRARVCVVLLSCLVCVCDTWNIQGEVSRVRVGGMCCKRRKERGDEGKADGMLLCGLYAPSVVDVRRE